MSQSYTPNYPSTVKATEEKRRNWSDERHAQRLSEFICELKRSILKFFNIQIFIVCMYATVCMNV